MTEGFKRIAIVGVGLIGGSLGLAIKRAGLDIKIVGISRSRTVATAKRLGAIDEGYSYEAMARGLEGVELVFLCTPILQILALMDQVSSCIGPGTIVTDVGSTKGEIVAKAGEVFGEEVSFVGGHPMAGAEKRGAANADPFLFQNAIYVLTPPEGAPEGPTERLRGLLGQLGARVVAMPPEQHDQIAAAISHLPQMLAVSLVNMVGKLNADDPFFLQLAAGGFRDMTRIASSPYEVWLDICETNRAEIAGMIDRYIEALGDLRKQLVEEGLEGAFGFANITRDAIPRDSKGFMHPHPEILVVAEDRPGIIAGISTLLAGEEININDIEVLKVREGEGGTLRLAFESEMAAARAVALLNENGYEARRR